MQPNALDIFEELVKAAVPEQQARIMVQRFGRDKNIDLNDFVKKSEFDVLREGVRKGFESMSIEFVKINSNFRLIGIFGSLVSAVIVIPALASWWQFLTGKISA